MFYLVNKQKKLFTSRIKTNVITARNINQHKSATCESGQQQTTNNTINTCPLNEIWRPVAVNTQLRTMTNSTGLKPQRIQYSRSEKPLVNHAIDKVP